jgi:hypothetical protein
MVCLPCNCEGQQSCCVACHQNCLSPAPVCLHMLNVSTELHSKKVLEGQPWMARRIIVTGLHAGNTAQFLSEVYLVQDCTNSSCTGPLSRQRVLTLLSTAQWKPMTSQALTGRQCVLLQRTVNPDRATCLHTSCGQGMLKATGSLC